MTVYFEEGFEGTGYENAVTAEVPGGTGAIDEDAAHPATPPFSGGSQCYEADTPANGDTAYSYWAGQTSRAISYIGAWIYVADNDMNAGAVGAGWYLLGNSGASFHAGFRLSQSDPGDALGVSGVYYNNGSSAVTSALAINEDQWYCCEFYLNKTDLEWAFRVDGVEIDSGTLTGTLNNSEILVVGDLVAATASGANKSYIDNGYWSDEGFRCGRIMSSLTAHGGLAGYGGIAGKGGGLAG